MNSVKLQIYLSRKLFNLIEMIIINDSYSENQSINFMDDFRILKIKDNDFNVLMTIDFITSKYDYIADIKCKI